MPIIFADIGPDVAAIFIPIVSIIGGIAVAIIAIIMGGRKKELRHKERIIAMEKGIDLPALQEQERVIRPAHKRHRTGGLVCTFLGAALSVAMWVSGGAIAGVWGLPLVGVGIGLLVSSAIERKEEAEQPSTPAGTA